MLLRPRARLIVTIHGPHWLSVRRKYGAFAEWGYSALSAIALFRADCVIAVSTSLADELSTKLPWLRTKIRVIPPMVDEEIFTPLPMEEARNRLGIPVTSRVVLFCGRLEKEKNVPLLLRVVRAVRDSIPATELVICGSGSQEESIRSMSAALGIPTRFIGNKDPREMPLVYASADVVVLTSEYEGLPTVILEALACGRPVISKSYPGSVHLAGMDGRLVLVRSDDNGSELSSSVISVLLRSSPSSVPPAILSDFSYRSVVKKILHAYEVLRTSDKAYPGVSFENGSLASAPGCGTAGASVRPSSAALVFVSNYSPMAVGGVGQFMIDLGAQVINQGYAISFCYRYEAPEFELPPRVAGASLYEVRGGPNPGLQTFPLLWRTAVMLFEARSKIGFMHLVVPQPMTAVAAVVAKVLHCPVLVTVFAPYPRKERKTAEFLHRIAERVVFRLADAVVYECEATQAQFPNRKGVVVFNGINTAYYHADLARRHQLRAKMGIEPDSFVAVYAGRIAEGKGIFDLLEAFATFPDELQRRSKLMLVGPIETDLTRILSRRQALEGRVIITGPVAKDEVRDYFQISDTFVLPSFQEGISSSLIEAMACSLPAIVSNVGGNPEVVVDRDCGFVIQAGDVDALRAALVTLAKEEESRDAMAQRARDRIEKFFTIENMSRSYVSEYERLLHP